MKRRTIGSIRERREGVWSVEVQCGFRADGRRRRVCRTVYGTREDAEAEALGIHAELNSNLTAFTGMTLKLYWEGIFPRRNSSRGEPRSRATMLYYEKNMKKWVLPRIGHLELNAITHQHLRDTIEQSGAPSGVKRTLSAVLLSAYDDGLLKNKPFDRRIHVKAQKREKVLPWNRFEAAEAINKILDYGDPRLSFYAILGMSGLRREEVLGLRACDISRESIYSYRTGEPINVTLLHVRQVFTDEGGIRQGAKNDNSLRSVPVLPSLTSQLDELIKERLSQVVGTELESYQEVIKSVMKGSKDLEQGAKVELKSINPADIDKAMNERLIDMSASGFSNLWKRTLEELEIRYIPPDMLRHTTDTLALTAGVAPDLNDKLHGRSTHSTTYQHYFIPDISAMHEAISKIDGLLN